MIAFESDFAPVLLPAAPFEAYLRDEGLDDALTTRLRRADAGPGRERFRRCAKAWIAGNDARRSLRPIGLPLEIVALQMPQTPGPLRIRVLSEGRPFAGALVKAWRRALGPGGVPVDPETRDSVGVAWKGRTDARGEVTVPVVKAGEWLLSVVRMVPSGDRATADWESTWASLAFQISGRADARTGGRR